nr:MAG TPA: hypothetical protein [Caudoviricetes sp.]
MRLCIIRHTIYDLKGSGLCREWHCLWAVPLLILQKNPLLCRRPALHAGYFVGKVGDFCFIHTSFAEALVLQVKT